MEIALTITGVIIVYTTIIVFAYRRYREIKRLRKEWNQIQKDYEINS